MTTAQILRNLRTERNLSQETVANGLGIDRTTYVKYENGSSVRRNLQKIADYFSVSTDYILGRNVSGGDNEMPSEIFSRAEIERIKKYRALKPEHKGAIDALMNYFYKNDLR